MADVVFRAARTDEAGPLGELALRSKGHWGYDRGFLEACRAELSFRPEDLRDRLFTVLESAGRVIGFYSLDGEPPAGELGNLWLDPDAIGAGLGRRMWRHAMTAARAAGFATVRIDAEPYAEGFYLAMGARRIGQTPSGSVPGRMLPLLEVRLTGPAPGGTATATA